MISGSAVSFDAVATLALQLLALEGQGGEAGERVTRLWAEVTAEQVAEAAEYVAEFQAEM